MSLARLSEKRIARVSVGRANLVLLYGIEGSQVHYRACEMGPITERPNRGEQVREKDWKNMPSAQNERLSSVIPETLPP